MRLIYYYILSTLLFGISSKPNFDIFELSESIIQDLNKNKIVTIKTDIDYGKGEHYQVYGIINANISEVFDAVDDFDNYHEFMPRFEHAECISPSDYIFNITLPMNIVYKYRIKINKSNPVWLAWETIPWEQNSIDETWGQWYLEPYGESKDKTLVQYQVYTDPGYIPFGFEWIINIMTEKSLPETVRNLKYWIENNEN